MKKTLALLAVAIFLMVLLVTAEIQCSRSAICKHQGAVVVAKKPSHHLRPLYYMVVRSADSSTAQITVSKPHYDAYSIGDTLYCHTQ